MVQISKLGKQNFDISILLLRGKTNGNQRKTINWEKNQTREYI